MFKDYTTKEQRLGKRKEQFNFAEALLAVIIIAGFMTVVTLHIHNYIMNI